MSAGERIRVIIVDDHSIVRVGLQQVLEQSGEFEVVGQASDGEEAVRAAADVSPDVVVMDVMMPKKDGVEACREIMASAPETRVLMLTASTTEDAVVEAIAAGATGYLQKDSRPEELAEAIREVAQGRLRIPDKSIRRVFAMIRGQAGAHRQPGPESAHRPGTGDPADVCQRQVLRPDRRGQWQQGRDRQELDLPHSEQAGRRYETGDGGLGREERPAGGRGAGWLIIGQCPRDDPLQLSRRVWGQDQSGGSGPVRAIVKRLRRELDSDADNPTFIFTEPRVGYWTERPRRRNRESRQLVEPRQSSIMNRMRCRTPIWPSSPPPTATTGCWRWPSSHSSTTTGES